MEGTRFADYPHYVEGKTSKVIETEERIAILRGSEAHFINALGHASVTEPTTHGV